MTKEVVTTLNVQISIAPATKCLVSAISEDEKERPIQLSYHSSEAWTKILRTAANHYLE